MSALRADAAEVRRSVALFLPHGDVIELRAPKTERDGVISGYFSDPEKLARAAMAIDAKAPGIYITLNPVNLDLLARADNRLKPRARELTIDRDVQRRRWLLLDFDPVRPAGISSTDAEHDLALHSARTAAMDLGALGWPAPVFGDSGNGAHLLCRIDLPNDAESAELVKAVLKAAAQRWNAPGVVEIDLTVFNASRISKIYGSVARKGDSTADRPHRLSRILDLPAQLDPVPLDLLRVFAAESVSEPIKTPAAAPRRYSPAGSGFSLEKFLLDHAIAIRRGPDVHDGSERWVLEQCPFNPAHAAPDAAIFRRLSDGRLGFKCLHNSCHGKSWEDFRRFYDPAQQKRRRGARQPHARQVPAIDSGSQNSPTDNDSYPQNLHRGSNGLPLPTYANVALALRHHPDVPIKLGFDELAACARIMPGSKWDLKAGTKLSDNHVRILTEWLQRHTKIYAGTSLVGEVALMLAEENKFNPLVNYLRGLVHDGVTRLNRVAATYLGASKDIENVFLRLWMISAVARGLAPGSKADCMIVLEGPQGAGKSRAIQALAGPGLYSDQLGDLGSKDAILQINGVWIVEISELDALGRAENSRIKAFISSSSDRLRLPYGRNVVDWPRSCVFAGTVNHDAYLKDETGGRRFFPIRCGHIDVAAIERDRDMLWAEAVDQFDHGAVWWLQDAGSIDHAAKEQHDRYQPGQWDSIITEWVDRPTERLDALGQPVAPLESTADFVTISDVLTHCVGKHKSQWTRSDQMAVASALKSLGWERFKRRRDGEKLHWAYRRRHA